MLFPTKCTVDVFQVGFISSTSSEMLKTGSVGLCVHGDEVTDI